MTGVDLGFEGRVGRWGDAVAKVKLNSLRG